MNETQTHIPPQQHVEEPSMKETRCNCGEVSSPSGICIDCAKAFPAFDTHNDVDSSGDRRRVHISYHQQTPSIQRKLLVEPSSEIGDVVSHLNKIYPDGKFEQAKVANQIVSGNSQLNPITQCTEENKPKYTVCPTKIAGTLEEKVMANKTRSKIPVASLFPQTANKTVYIPSQGLSCRFGSFDSHGVPHDYENWRILAHELGGHAITNFTHESTEGDRPGHDKTIRVENAIATNIAGSIPRGYYANPRQGESYFKESASARLMTYVLKDGWHYDDASSIIPGANTNSIDSNDEDEVK